ncbi:MAG TPA: fumarylacetoacetate hydrolase family protein [Stellaceae bacterium]|nr:fumarylacetoacetate hydrolase family protein [Stellaceae bacterium]
MATAAVVELGERLAAAWEGGTPLGALPAHLVPSSAEEAYAAQAILLARLTPRLGPIVGWKVGAPSPTAGPTASPLLADLVQPSLARFGGPRLRLRGIEAEVAFRFGRALPPRSEPYGEAEVSEAIHSIHPGIELVETRFEAWEGPAGLAKLADLGSNGGFCFGPGSTDWRSRDLGRPTVTLEIDGKRIAERTGGNTAGHPMRTLVWLANHTGRLGHGLKAGDIVTTGSHTGLVFTGHDSRVVARVAGLGEANLVLSEV